MSTKFESAELRPAKLALADGKIFHGRAFGAARGLDNPIVGEVVFNTSMYGYQEILTDPSYAGQILTFTYPHIGNVGCNREDVEGDKFFAEGLIIRDLAKRCSNFRSTLTLPDYVLESGKMGLCDIDTRSLVIHLRDNGAQMGAMACGEKIDEVELVSRARAAGSMSGKDYVKAVTCSKAYSWTGLPWNLSEEGTGKNARAVTSYPSLKEDAIWGRPHVVAIDCGIKHNILRLLCASGFRVTVVPATSTAEQIRAHKPDALFLSNGPGDPATLSYIVNPVKELLGKLPIFGICLGHQILGQVLGGKTYKLKFGHRGGNHPVLDTLTSKVEITVQNHGFAVDEASLPKSAKALISHINLNDRTVEGISAPELRAFSVQYHPEASPGPHDSAYLFKRFFESVVTQ